MLVIVLLSLITSAQTPQSFRYQAVARDNSGNILAGQPVSFRISILSGSVSGVLIYSETHTSLSTNTFGLVELEIGKGTPVTGTFSSINWVGNTCFVKVKIDPAGGSAYQVLSTSQLLRVPYALHAQTVETGDNWGSQKVVTAAASYGVFGISSSASGYGLYGEAPLFGVYAKSTGNTGRAINGEAMVTGSIGAENNLIKARLKIVEDTIGTRAEK